MPEGPGLSRVAFSRFEVLPKQKETSSLQAGSAGPVSGMHTVPYSLCVCAYIFPAFSLSNSIMYARTTEQFVEQVQLTRSCSIALRCLMTTLPMCDSTCYDVNCRLAPSEVAEIQYSKFRIVEGISVPLPDSKNEVKQNLPGGSTSAQPGQC